METHSLPEDLSDLVIKHLTTYHYYVYTSRLFSSFLGTNWH
jgi:hypothetical protein